MPKIQVVLKGFRAGLLKKQILNLFEVQAYVVDLDKSISTLSEARKYIGVNMQIENKTQKLSNR